MFVLVALAIAAGMSPRIIIRALAAQSSSASKVPIFEVDTIWPILLRDTLEILTSFGDGGRQPGEFYAVHSIATDSKGNIFTTETYRGQRVQKFVYRGVGPVMKKDQGVVWPRNAKSP